MKNKTFLTSIIVTLFAMSPLSQAVADNGPVVVGNITINIVDFVPVLGFGDPTPAAPVGGNTGTTVGQQRFEAYKRAAEIWDAALDIDQQVVLQAVFVPLTCSANSGVLGAAGALTVFRDFPGPSFPSTWYAAALANELAGTDLGGTTPDPGFQAPPYNDEIFSLFNSALGSPGCLENSGWYYGLDNNNPAGTIDFLAVLLHEVGHGLGFQNFVNDAAGSNFLGYPDQWSRFERDNLISKHWDQMIDIERAFSATNGPNLVWSGPAVTAEAPNVLGPAQVILVNAPPPIDGAELPFGTANFGPMVPAGGLEGYVMLANDGVGAPSDGCEPLANNLTGKIALIDRGSCNFTAKAINAQDAGAIGVIIANNVPGATPPGLGGSDPAVVVPTVSVTLNDGALLRYFGADTNVTIGIDSSQGTLAGADENGLVKLYAPFPVQPGSSVSHFDVSASPNVLMEPFINGDLQPTNPLVGLDLTDDLLNDIGWDGNISCPVDSDSRSTVKLFEFCETGVENRQGTYTVLPPKAWIPAAYRGSAAGGCFIQDVVNACLPVINIDGSGGQYHSCIVQVTNDLRRQGNLSKSEANSIQACSEIIAPLLNP